MASDVTLVLTTTPSSDAGLDLVESLVRERHAACGTVLPGGLSVYWWQGRVVREPEALVLLKTARDHTDALLTRIAELHPYDVPEALAFPVERGHEPYLSWVLSEVSSNP